MDKQKNLILAVAASIAKQPTAQDVKKLRTAHPDGFASMRSVMVELGLDPTEAEIAGASTWYAKFRALSDKDFAKQYPHLEALWTGTVASVSTSALLAQVNELRAAKNMPPLKSAKMGRAYLETQLSMLAQAPQVKKASPTEKETSDKKPSNGPTITLASIASELDIAPKVARAIARRHKAELAKLEAGKKYHYLPKHKNRIAAVLSGK